MSGSANRSDSKTTITTHNNATLVANNITINTRGNTQIVGATLHADDTLNLDTQNLTVASVQDVEISKTRGEGISASGGSSATAAGSGQSNTSLGSAGFNNSRSDRYNKETVLTSLTGNTVNINVEQHTELTGATIAALDEDGNDNGQLTLNTNTLSASSLNNITTKDSLSQSISAGSTTTLDYQNDRVNEKTKTLATLGTGNIDIKDIDNSDIKMLNSDVENNEVDIYDIESHQGLSATVDTRLFSEDGRAQIKEDFETTQAGIETITNHVQAWTNSVPQEIKIQVGEGLEKHYDALIRKGYEPEQIEAMMQDEKVIQFLQYAISLENELAANDGVELEFENPTPSQSDLNQVDSDGPLDIRIVENPEVAFNIRVSESLQDGAQILNQLPQEDIDLALQLVIAVTGGPVKVVLGEAVNQVIIEAAGQEIEQINRFVTEKAAEHLNERPDDYYVNIDGDTNETRKELKQNQLDGAQLGITVLGAVAGVKSLGGGGKSANGNGSSDSNQVGGADTNPVKNSDGYEVPETVTRRDNDFSSPVNEKGIGKSRIDEDGTLVPTNPDADVNVTRHVRNDPDYKNNAPTTSTSEVDGSNAPRDYGKDQIEVDTGRLQRDINDGKVTDVEIIPHNQIQGQLHTKVDAAKKRFDDNPSDKNADRLEAAERDLNNAVNDNECLLVGCVPKNYIKGGQ